MFARATLLAVIAVFCFTEIVYAHFGMIIPSSSTLMTNRKADSLKFTIAFAHPFAGEGMNMQKPHEFFVVRNGKKSSLLEALTPAKHLGADAFSAHFTIDRPGVYQFAIVPEPYFESAEQSYIIHYAKTIVGAFGSEHGWNHPLNLPVEIVPLSRPFGNYAGNTFTGLVLKNGKALANSIVEVEFYNNPPTHKEPNAYFETQTLLTDNNGIFTFGIPWAGWWGFAALTDADYKISRDGKDYDVELGGIIWVNFAKPQLVK